jgi:hypothetical protein
MYDSGNIQNPAPWQNGVNPAAVGTKPAPVTPVSTAGGAVNTAIGLGNRVYSQLPGYSTDISNIGKNITAETAGQLPQDVIDQITNEAAARGVATGTGAGPMNLDLLKTLGLTSLNLTQMGQAGLNAQLGMLPGAALYQNPAFYPTTAQTLEAGEQNALNAAAPDPFAAANAAIRSAGAGYAAGSVGGTTLPSTTITPTMPGGPTALGPGASTSLGMLSDILNTYNPTSAGGSSDLVTGNMYGGGPGSDETQLAPDQLSSLYDTFGNAGSDFVSSGE